MRRGEGRVGVKVRVDRVFIKNLHILFPFLGPIVTEEKMTEESMTVIRKPGF